MSHTQIERSYDTIVMEETRAYLGSLSGPTKLSRIRDGLHTAVNQALRAAAASGAKHPMLRQLTPWQVAQVLRHVHILARVNLAPGRQADRTMAVLRVYRHEGRDQGLYIEAEDALLADVAELAPTLTSSNRQLVLDLLSVEAPILDECRDRNLNAVNNGVYSRETKSLLDFAPELVFTRKSRVNFKDGAASPVLVGPDGLRWEFDEWLRSLSDDPEVVELLWELLSAAVRPNERWDRAAFLYSPQGNNGKGTFVEVMRNLLGEGSHASIPLADWGKDFMLSELINATAVIVDENDVGHFMESAGQFKAAVTGDVIVINRKHLAPVSMRFRGLIVQCVNSFPRTKDKSDSFARRQLFVPFTKSFKGIERKYIKDDFLRREEVLEYVLQRVLKMEHTKLSEPAACTALLEEYRIDNDPVREFWAEFEDQFAWSFLPTSFLFDLFSSWSKRTNPTGKGLSQIAFTRQLRVLLGAAGGWVYHADKTGYGTQMDAPEPLIHEYQLEHWLNPGYTGSDPLKAGSPALARQYRAFEKI